MKVFLPSLMMRLYLRDLLPDLLHFAYDPGSGNYALSLGQSDWQGVFLCLEEKAEIYSQWASFEEFLNLFVEE